MKWSKTDIHKVKKEYDLGTSINKISQDLKISEYHIKKLAKKLNLRHATSWSDYEIKILKEMLKTNSTLDEICFILTKSIHSVRKKVKELNLTITGNGGIDLNKEAITYLVYLPDLDVYKVGITNKSTSERMIFGLNSDNYELILERHFNNGKDARLLEIKWLENLKPYLYNSHILPSGNTETFRYGPN
jgi:hypothetical protein